MAPSQYAAHRAMRPRTRTVLIDSRCVFFDELTCGRLLASPSFVAPSLLLSPGDAAPAGSLLGPASRTRPAKSLTRTPTRDARARWRNGDRCGASRPPRVAPARPPKLQAAWNPGITGLRRAATSSMAMLFIATFRQP